jgi:hypothetical protein
LLLFFPLWSSSGHQMEYQHAVYSLSCSHCCLVLWHACADFLLCGAFISSSFDLLWHIRGLFWLSDWWEGNTSCQFPDIWQKLHVDWLEYTCRYRQMLSKIKLRWQIWDLQLGASVWTTICCNSFAKCYFIQHKLQFSKHSTRQTLKSKGTDRETD